VKHLVLAVVTSMVLVIGALYEVAVWNECRAQNSFFFCQSRMLFR
jgi:hypothetical protein